MAVWDRARPTILRNAVPPLWKLSSDLPHLGIDVLGGGGQFSTPGRTLSMRCDGSQFIRTQRIACGMSWPSRRRATFRPIRRARGLFPSGIARGSSPPLGPRACPVDAHPGTTRSIAHAVSVWALQRARGVSSPAGVHMGQIFLAFGVSYRRLGFRFGFLPEDLGSSRNPLMSAPARQRAGSRPKMPFVLSRSEASSVSVSFTTGTRGFAGGEMNGCRERAADANVRVFDVRLGGSVGP
ncbi:hypothetical protein OF83DRAFT_296206 [Amylostereum chailletii]|nr:hypothetical protein OF83DRAFT_296206 [Amylostereum chailletii]